MSNDVIHSVCCVQVLYLKNLHSSVTAADLEAVFGALRPTAEWQSELPWVSPQVRLMTGRLRGQAFITFSCKNDIITHSMNPPKCSVLIPKVSCSQSENVLKKTIAGVEDAVKALNTINGFMMKGKPVIISYGRARK